MPNTPTAVRGPVPRALPLAWLALWLGSACGPDASTDPSMEPTATDPAAVYSAVHLGALGGTTGEASDMADGRIVGDAETEDGRFHAFLWERGEMRDLGALPNSALTSSRAMALNSAGQVVGFSLTDEDVSGGGSAEHAFLWQNGTMQDLGTLGGSDSRALDINGSGLIVGHAQNEAGHQRAVLWRNGVIRDLGTLGGTESAALGVNAHGVIVGRAATATGTFKAFVWREGRMRALGTLGGDFTQANAINSTGRIVGYGTTRSGAVHAILWDNGETIDLGTLPGDQESYAMDIDDAGRIAGFGDRAPLTGERTRVFVWREGVLRHLGNSAGKPNRALGISPNGHVVGSSTVGGNQVATLWRRE